MLEKTDALCPVCNHDGKLIAAYKNIYENKKLLQCAVCGLHFIWPTPSGKDLRNIYTKEYYDAWSINDLGAEGLARMKSHTFNAILDAIARFKRGGAILDIGCAFGDFLNIARGRGWDVYGIEFSAHAAEEAGKKIGEERIWQSDFIHSHLSGRHFDVITMIDVLEHEHEVGFFLKRAHDLLNPDGVIVILTPDMDSPSRKILQKSWPHFNREHLVYFSRSTINRILARKGFKVLDSLPFKKAFNFHYIKCQIDAHGKKFFRGLIHLFLFFMPKLFWRQPFFMFHGEMLIIAEKSAYEKS